jgi:hypothetical protein
MNRWHRLWDHHEHPRSLAVLRILVGLVILIDLLEVGRLGLVDLLFVDASLGGIVDVSRAGWVSWLGPSREAGLALYGAQVLGAGALTIGLRPRLAAVVLALCWAQSALLLPAADRAIDVLLRNVLWILAFSRCGSTCSVDAWWRGERALDVPAWPRRLVILQLVLLYFTAGVQKIGHAWTPMGDFDALFLILQDPAVARFDFGWIRDSPMALLGTRLGTAGTVVWELCSPVVLLGLALRGRGVGILARIPWHLIWVGIGVAFHIGIAVLLDLGIFPMAMLATYSAFVHPDWWKSLGDGMVRLMGLDRWIGSSDS